MNERKTTSPIISFFKDAATYAVSGMATTFIGVVMVPIYTRVFTPSEYGALDLIATLIAFLIMFLLMGQQSAVGRFYVDAADDRDRRISASTSGLFLFLLSATVASVMLIFHRTVAVLLHGTAEFSTAVAFAIAAVPFTISFRFLQNMLKWRQESTKYLAVSVCSMVLGLGLTIYLVVVARQGLPGVYIAMLANALTFACVGVILSRTSFIRAVSWSKLKELLAFGAPLVPVSVAFYLITYSDRFVLRFFMGLDTVGIYAIAVRVALVMALMLNGFEMALGPFVYAHYKEEDARKNFSRIFDYVSLAVVLGVTGLSLFATDIIRVFATSTYLEAHIVVPLLAAGTAIYGLGAYFAFGIGIAKKTIHRAWTALLAGGMNVCLNLVLVPRIGMLGAAAATAFSFLTLSYLQMRISQRLYRVPYRFGRNFIVYVAAAAVIAIAYISGLERSSLALIPVKLGLVGVVLAVAVAVGLVSKSEFEKLRRMIRRA